MKKLGAKILLLVGAMSIAAGAEAARASYGPGERPAPVGLESHPNAQVPLSAKFRDEEGNTVELGKYFRAGKPVIVLPVYYGCNKLCTGTLNELRAGLDQRPLRLELGKDFEVVTISIDPSETPALAKEKRANYLKALGKSDLVGGWHFLTGDEEEIRRVTNVLGFFYIVDMENGYDHAQALYILTPEGRISSTVTDKVYTEPTVSLHDRLVNASNGRIGNDVIGLLSKCGLMKYDPRAGRYVHNPWMWAATIGGALSIITVGVFLGSMWRGEYKKAKLAKQNSHSATGTPAAGI